MNLKKQIHMTHYMRFIIPPPVIEQKGNDLFEYNINVNRKNLLTRVILSYILFEKLRRFGATRSVYFYDIGPYRTNIFAKVQ